MLYILNYWVENYNIEIITTSWCLLEYLLIWTAHISDFAVTVSSSLIVSIETVNITKDFSKIYSATAIIYCF